jgi:hypothetical protein
MVRVPDRPARAVAALTCVGMLALALSVYSGARASAGQPEGQAMPAEPEGAEYAANELLVKFASNVPAERAEAIHEQLGVEVLDRKMLGGRLHLVRVPEGRSLEEVQSAYEAQAGVEYAERNPTYRVQGGAQQVEGQ